MRTSACAVLLICALSAVAGGAEPTECIDGTTPIQHVSFQLVGAQAGLEDGFPVWVSYGQTDDSLAQVDGSGWLAQLDFFPSFKKATTVVPYLRENTATGIRRYEIQPAPSCSRAYRNGWCVAEVTLPVRAFNVDYEVVLEPPFVVDGAQNRRNREVKIQEVALLATPELLAEREHDLSDPVAGTGCEPDDEGACCPQVLVDRAPEQVELHLIGYVGGKKVGVLWHEISSAKRYDELDVATWQREALAKLNESSQHTDDAPLSGNAFRVAEKRKERTELFFRNLTRISVERE